MKQRADAKRFDERRQLLKAGAGLVGAAGLSSLLSSTDEAAEFTPGDVEAYADRISCVGGEEIGLCVSTAARMYDVEVARVGAKREVVLKKTGVTGRRFEMPDDASAQGCRWPVALKIPTGRDWRSGYYQVVLTAANGRRG